MQFAFGFLLLLTAASSPAFAETPVFEGAEGFGAVSKGGTGGAVLRVNTLVDDPHDPRPGSLRWAVAQTGPRIVRFDVSGNIRLKVPLIVTEPYLTLDGGDAPAPAFVSAATAFVVEVLTTSSSVISG